MSKPEQLRLAADIIEKNLPWERRTRGSQTWFSSASSDPAILVVNGWEIRVAPPPPEPVPLTAEDVPPGSVIRNNPPNKEVAWWAVIMVTHEGVMLGHYNPSVKTYAALMHHGDEIKRPGSDTWEPCSKPA